MTSTLLREERKRADAGAPVELPDDLLPGVGAEERPLRDVMRTGGWATIGVLFGLNLVDEFDRIAVSILGPDIQRTFDINDTALTALTGIGAVAVFLAAVPLGVLADRRRRTMIIGVTSTLWAAFALIGGLTRNAVQLAATRVFNGLGKGNGPVVNSLLADRYPIEGRGRVFAFYNLANALGNMLGPLAAGGIAAIAGGDEGWRWSLLLLSIPALALAIAALNLKEPRRGSNEKAALHIATDTEADPIPLTAAFERLRKVKTFSAIMSSLGALGLGIAGVPVITNLLLEDQYGLDGFGRGVVASVTAVGGLIGTLIGGREADRLFRQSPERVLRLVGVTIGAFGVLYVTGLYMPQAWMLVVVHGIAGGFAAAPLAMNSSLVASIVPYRMRGVAFSVVGIYLVLVGGLFGGVLAGVLSDAMGERTAITVLMPLATLAAGAFILSAARHVRGDIAMVVAELRDEETERKRMRRRAKTDDVLQVRNLDFSYGQVQVLFGVELDVRRGETLALLGTNGAGKSTVLRALSGLALPDRGSVRFNGRDITFTPATDRVRRGIVQVAGGKAVFGSLTVQENLLAGAHTFMWDADRVERKAADVLELFPKLAELLDQPAHTLSGGEQQMLGLAKALLLEPELLLIDELSLGLAPVAVQEILATIDTLKERGVTMIIVEQSLNVALSIAERAVFMEKGRVRFEGRTKDLAERDDLVRAVFLGKNKR